MCSARDLMMALNVHEEISKTIAGLLRTIAMSTVARAFPSQCGTHTGMGSGAGTSGMVRALGRSRPPLRKDSTRNGAPSLPERAG